MNDDSVTLEHRFNEYRFCEQTALYVPVRQVQELLREYQGEVETLTRTLSFDFDRLRKAERDLVTTAREFSCEYSGDVEVRYYSDGTRFWDCPRCGDAHEEHRQ